MSYNVLIEKRHTSNHFYFNLPTSVLHLMHRQVCGGGDPMSMGWEVVVSCCVGGVPPWLLKYINIRF